MGNTMTINTKNGWHLKGVPDSALENIKGQPYGNRVLEALAYLAAIERIAGVQEEKVQNTADKFEWYAPEDMVRLISGTEVLCELKNTLVENQSHTGQYIVLTYYKGGQKLDNEVPVNVMLSKDASVGEKLMGALFANNMEEYSHYAPQSGFYELLTGKDGYSSRRMVPGSNIVRWAYLPAN